MGCPFQFILKIMIERLETKVRSLDLKKYFIKMTKHLIKGPINLKYDLKKP